MQEIYRDILRRRQAASPFDREAGMLTEKVEQHKGTFYTGLSGEYHVVRESIFYGLGLMQTDPEANRETVERMLRTVCALQDSDPASPTFGVWPLYLEEPLDRQPRPDWNWADFCGRGLLLLLLGYGSRFSESVQAEMRQCIRNAARRIMLRDVSPAYTNISCMGSYTVLAAGEYLKDTALWNYGRERFRKLYSFNSFHQCVSEYNSSTYTIESLLDLSLIAKDIHDVEIHRQAQELLDMQWGYTLEHFCPDNGQWTGPQSRCYQTLQGDRLLSFLQLGAGARAALIPPERMLLEPVWLQAGLEIPDRWMGMLTARDSHFFRRHPVLLDEPEIYASQYRDGSRSLGSFSFCDFWTQRRPVIAYFGAGETTGYLRLRCIHDDFDFTSGLLACAQSQNLLVCGISLCNDHGDRHFTMDPIADSAIRASRLCFRLEFGGGPALLRNLRAERRDYGWRITAADTAFEIALGRNGFQGKPLTVQWLTDGDTRCLDLILYAGPERAIDLRSGTQAYAALALGMFRADSPAAEAWPRQIGQGPGEIWLEDGYSRYGVTYAQDVQPYGVQLARLRETRSCKIVPARHVWRVKAKTDFGES